MLSTSKTSPPFSLLEVKAKHRDDDKHAIGFIVDGSERIGLGVPQRTRQDADRLSQSLAHGGLHDELVTVVPELSHTRQHLLRQNLTARTDGGQT